ncbi:hypothetical protein BJ875DRAFT_496766 [Amylocarpus encephaloides]|uniref:CPAF-like PDZ domain-containing protein n=1 Tax=Amylocarpus encephaloides TaxID=45428 RepID=A0A9P7YGG0_9HELO|nr:hypothetical protein BJ875DRAFT_496766 [Amylocarpus encephaloides]
MRVKTILPVIAVSSSCVAAAPTTTNNSPSPCGLITSGMVEFYGNEDALLAYEFAPSLAQACLASSTINTTLAVIYIIELKKYIQFQSTLAYLKDPPSDYAYPPVDIMGGLDDIAQTAADGGYESQFAFDQALEELIVSAHEGHLGLSQCTSGIIHYQRGEEGLELVSVSEDGVKLPEVWMLEDLQSGQDSPATITHIDGVEVNDVLQELALNSLSDPDASYNSLFWSYGKAPSAGSFKGDFTLVSAYHPLEDYTTISFSNGSSFRYENIAKIYPGSWYRSIVDGETFTEAFCLNREPSSTDSDSDTTAATSTAEATGTTAPTLLGYPYYPVAKDPSNQVAGYFLNKTGYDDTGVLFIPSFLNSTAPALNSTDTFIKTVENFLAAAKEGNKSKLIIDMSGNGGGNKILPNDVMQRLFPSIEPLGQSRLRINLGSYIVGATLEAVPDSELAISSSDDEDIADLKTRVTYSPWNYRSALSTDLKNFTGWTHGERPYFSPVEDKGDNFTAIGRLPLNNTLYDEWIDSFVPYGYDGQPELPQPFAIQNVVLLTDGYCASACSILAEFLTRQAGVKTIVVGGRPLDAPMQAIGGTKGSQVETFQSLTSSLSILHLKLPNISKYIPEALVPWLEILLPGTSGLPLGDPENLKNYSLNFRDNIADGDTAEIPLQFIFEPADCRIFYTPQTVFDPLSLWEHVHDVAWKGAQCAWGGMNTEVSDGSSP